MNKYVLVGLLCLTITIKLNAQFINVGDSMPDLEFKHMINYPGGKAKLSDFKGKLVILDLWGKYCSACIAGFPKMQELQEKYKDKIQILLVTEDKEEDYNKLKLNSTYIQNNKLPVVFLDSTAKKTLNVRSQLLHLWIGKDRILRAITNVNNATHENIEKFLGGGDITHFSNIQNDSFIDFDSFAPLLNEGNGRLLKQIQSYSLFITGIKGTTKTGMGPLTDTTGATIGISDTNVPFLFLVSGAYGYKYQSSDILLEFKNYKSYLKPTDPNEMDTWRRNYLYSYEMKLGPNEIVSGESNLDRNRRIERRRRQDLENFFQIKFIEEERDIEVYKLVSFGNSIRVKSDESKKNLSEITLNRIVIRGPILNLITNLKRILQTERDKIIRLENATGYSGLVDVDFTYKEATVSAVNEVLKKYGFKIVQQMEKRKVLVVQDNG